MGARGIGSGARALLLACGLSLTAVAAAAEDLKPSGTVTIDQVQVAFMLSGNLGGGVLTFEGKSYEFTVGGLGVGGFGASSIHARGTIYNLKRLEDFVGAYGQARTGIAAGDQGGGTLWLENSKGVYMELESERKGLALSLGADAVYIGF